MGMMPPSSNAVVVTVNPGLAGGRGVAGACATAPAVAIDNTSAPSNDCFALNKPPSGPILPFLFIPLPQSANFGPSEMSGPVATTLQHNQVAVRLLLLALAAAIVSSKIVQTTLSKRHKSENSLPQTARIEVVDREGTSHAVAANRDQSSPVTHCSGRF